MKVFLGGTWNESTWRSRKNGEAEWWTGF